MEQGREVLSILEEEFKKVNLKMLKLEMQYNDNIDIIEDNEETSTVMIETVGDYRASFFFCAANSVLEKLADKMAVKAGSKITYKQVKIYVKEYLNIVCGKTITMFNNISHRRIKISVPVFVDGIYRDEEEDFIREKYLPGYDNKDFAAKDIFYRCDCGNLKLSIKYDLSTI